MTRDEVHSAITDFFDVVDGSYSSDERETKLQFALDQLALAYHSSDFVIDEAEYPDAPDTKFEDLYKLVGSNFPNLGYYNTALDVSTEIAQTSLGVADAIDDICDIAIELKRVLWCWENTSINDALWHFRESYDSHWGCHLRDLQLYLLKKTQDQ